VVGRLIHHESRRRDHGRDGWDTDSYQNLDEDQSMSDATEAGHVRIWLAGQKLTGGYTLQRMRDGSGSSASKPRWLLIKRRDEGADARGVNPESTQPQSVKSGRTIAQIADEDA
jgi:hypothetical protein